MADEFVAVPDLQEDINLLPSHLFLAINQQEQAGRKITYANFYKQIMSDLMTKDFAGLFNMIKDMPRADLLTEGFTIQEILLWELMKVNLSHNIGANYYLDCTQDELDELLLLPVFEETGWQFANGDNGTTNKQGTFPRIIDLGADRDTGRTMGTYQEDALQKMTGSTGFLFSQGDRPDGVFALKREYDSYLGGPNLNKVRELFFDNSLVARTSSETRPKTIYFPYFQVVKKLDYRTINYKQPTALS